MRASRRFAATLSLLTAAVLLLAALVSPGAGVQRLAAHVGRGAAPRGQIADALGETGGVAKARTSADAFNRDFDILRRRDLNVTGRDALVRAYEELIQRHRGDPRSAAAMMELASLWECHSPTAGYTKNERAALSWFREATLAAEPGSEVWKRAHFYLANRVSWEDMAKARALVARVQKHAQFAGDHVTLAQVEDRLLSFCLQERDIDGAEAHFVRLLKWYDDPRRVAERDDKAAVDSLMRGAARVMMHTFETAPWPREQRVERLMRYAHGRAAAFLRPRTEDHERWECRVVTTGPSSP